ncbi:MAG: hypothetical protein QXV32_04770 [Conexivisphaerales archaeon]
MSEENEVVGKRRLAAVPVLAVSFIMWFIALFGASNAGFFLDQTDLQWMVVGGSVCMVAGGIAALWE